MADDFTIKTHITGCDKLIRKFDRKIEGMDEALDEGCQEAADHLLDSIEDKFGVYQKSWAKLKYETIIRKVRKGSGNGNKPLVDTGDMMFSFQTQTSNKTRNHTVTVFSDDPKLPYHVYGAPSANVPKRDPVRPTTIEERDNCLDIIKEKVKEFFNEI